MFEMKKIVFFTTDGPPKFEESSRNENLINIMVIFYELEKLEFMNEKEVFKICNQIDNAIAEQLAESIIKGTSYEKLEAHYGIIPISKNCFYRKRRKAQKIMNKE